MRSHYRTLQLPHDATSEDIHRAYRSLARRYHPDRNPDRAAADLMVHINEAYQCLIDPARRRAYDERFVAAEPAGIREAVLDAAAEQLRRADWRWRGIGSAGFPDGDAVLAKDTHCVGVRFVGLMGQAETDDWLRALATLYRPHGIAAAVCLACRITGDMALPANGERSVGVAPATAIDLVGSRVAGPRIPEPYLGELFAGFLVE